MSELIRTEFYYLSVALRNIFFLALLFAFTVQYLLLYLNIAIIIVTVPDIFFELCFVRDLLFVSDKRNMITIIRHAVLA